MARKTFLNGYPLPASDLNTYLMDQTVQTYADATARTAALATRTEGQMSYLADQNTAYVYDGSSWNAVVDAKNYGSVLPTRRNAIINGGFDIWQRGTSFAPAASVYTANTADRWNFIRGGFATGSTISRQSSGLTGFQYAARVQRDSGNTSTATMNLSMSLESATSIPFAGQAVTLSFYARAGANYSNSGSGIRASLGSGTGTDQNFQSGFTGFATVVQETKTLTTSWQRFSITGTVSSSATQLGLQFDYTPVGTAGAADYFEVTGVQLEAGSVATPFARAAGTVQGELAACQRYYYRSTGSSYTHHALGSANSTAGGFFTWHLPVTLRALPSSIEYSTLGVWDGASTFAVTAVSIQNSGLTAIGVAVGVASGLTQWRPYHLFNNANANGYLAINAEL